MIMHNIGKYDNIKTMGDFARYIGKTVKNWLQERMEREKN